MINENEFKLIVAKNLIKFRKANGLTQLELAEKFNYSDKSISKWEKGESMPSVEVLCELAEFYGVSLDYLTAVNPTDETPKATKSKKEPKARTPRMFPTRLVITLLSVAAVWLCATVLFVLLKIFAATNYYMAFMWAGVASCVVLIVFNSIWGKRWINSILISALIWTFTLSLYDTVKSTPSVNSVPDSVTKVTVGFFSVPSYSKVLSLSSLLSDTTGTKELLLLLGSFNEVIYPKYPPKPITGINNNSNIIFMLFFISILTFFTLFTPS